MLATNPPTDPVPMVFLKRVGWTRGEGCHVVAGAISADKPVQLGGDLTDSCVTRGVDAVVMRRLTRFELVPTIVPSKVNLDATSSVTVAVGDGPHSPLATALGARLAAALDVPGEVRTVFRSSDEAVKAVERLDHLAEQYPHLDKRLVNVSNVDGLVEDLPPTSVLVVGAPGGSWMQRQIFGPGHRLRVAAPGGVIVVRSAPRRCFQDAVRAAERVASPHLTVAIARQLMVQAVVPVAESGTLVGLLRRSALDGADPEITIDRLMEPPVAVEATESIAAVADLSDFLEFSPVPVVGSGGRLVGTIDPRKAGMQ